MMQKKPAVLITGASRGLGRALLNCYCLYGWRTFPLVRDAQIAKHLAAEMTDCLPIVGDVTSDSVAALVGETVRKVGRLDVLINNAGIPGQATLLDAVTPFEINALFQTHCLGALRCTHAALPFMQDGRRIIVNMTSRFGSTVQQASGEYAGRSTSYAYRIAKAGLNMLTACLSQELGPQGFIVAAVHPGRLKTASGSRDAVTEPIDAATRLYGWIAEIDSTMNGKCFDLEKGEVMAW